ncbi:MAG: M1 family aminopeptidase [Vulcanimicrobiaceae bacterium]
MAFIDEAHRSFALPGARLQYGPDKTVDVEHIDLRLQPDLGAQTLDGICTTTVQALDEDVIRLSLDAVDLQIARVECEGQAVPFHHRDGKLTLTFKPAIAAGSHATFSVTYRAQRPRAGLFFVEPNTGYPERIAHLWTQSQDENARYWFPCLDYPHEKQTTSTTIIVPVGQFALANGALVERRDEGAHTIFRYEQKVPHATYLMTLVVGPFLEVEQGTVGKNGVPVFYYVLPGRRDDGGRSFGNTPRMIELFEEKLGTAYPFARYSQIAVSDFIFGGMENTSATTQTDRTLHDATAHLDFSSDPLVSHELAHQWFGDLLTCRDWSHAWLNEGFATYFECIWREADLGWDEYLYDVFDCVARYIEEDATRYRRPIVCNRFRDPIELFDGHLYAKGGAVLHMLRGELGDARFWRSIRRYVADNAGQNVETIDLIRAIEQSTGRNMREFFDRWVFAGGHPEIEYVVTWDAQRGAATVTIDQKQSVSDDSPAFVFQLEIGFVPEVPEKPASDAGPGPLADERRVLVRVERSHETVTIALPFEPKLVRFDPGAWILSDAAYKLGSAFAGATLQGDPDVVARIRAARALAKDGSPSAQAALRRAFAQDPFWGVLAQAAAAVGATRAPWAAALLRDALGHAHPKVRVAVAAALGNFRDPQTATALVGVAHGEASYFVRAAALQALGKTRDPRAFDVLAAVAAGRSWNGIVEAGAVRGLAELADPRATAIVLEAAQPGNDEGVRRAAMTALGRIGELLESERTRVVEALDRGLDDRALLVQLAAIEAAESLGDRRLLSTVERLSCGAADGRARRDAGEALIRITQAQRVPAQVGTLRDDVDRLREEQRKLQEQIERLASSATQT